MVPSKSNTPRRVGPKVAAWRPLPTSVTVATIETPVCTDGVTTNRATEVRTVPCGGGLFTKVKMVSSLQVRKGDEAEEGARRKAARGTAARGTAASGEGEKGRGRVAGEKQVAMHAEMGACMPVDGWGHYTPGCIARYTGRLRTVRLAKPQWWTLGPLQTRGAYPEHTQASPYTMTKGAWRAHRVATAGVHRCVDPRACTARHQQHSSTTRHGPRPARRTLLGPPQSGGRPRDW